MIKIVSDHGFPKGDGSLSTDDAFERFKNERSYIAQSGRAKTTVAAMDWAIAEIERLRAGTPDYSLTEIPMATIRAPVPAPDGAGKCSCGPMCQDLGKVGGCRYLRPERATLRALVDAVWQHATESKSVPSTDTADKLIDSALPSGAGAAEPVATCPSCGWKFHVEAATSPVRGDRETIARLLASFDGNCFEGMLGVVIQEHDKESYRRRADRILSLPVQPGAGEREARLREAAKAVALHRPLAKQVCHVPTALMHELVDALIQAEGNSQ